MTVKYILDFVTTENHWLITWSLEESENYDRFALEDGTEWMDRLVPVREELMRGDIRSLYIGWLAAVSRDMVDIDELEPFMLDGLGKLTSAQCALAEFLEVDKDLLEGARMGTADRHDDNPTEQEMNDWLEKIPPNEVLALLKKLLEGHSLEAERVLKNRFSAWRRSKRNTETIVSQRTVGELLKYADEAKNIRLEQKKKKKAMIEAQRARENEEYLASIAKDFSKAWNEIQKKVDKGSGAAYNEACRALVDLSEAYTLYKNKILFSQDLKVFMNNNIRRRALVQRVVKVGLWHET